MNAVFQHELTMYSHSMKTYIFSAFLLVLTGVGAMLYNIQASVANFEYVLEFISISFIILVPILTMRSMAEERRQKTDQLLYSLPISTADIITGKFLSLAVVFACPMVLICIYPLLFSRFGDVYLAASYGTIIAFFFLGLALMSIGLFISCLTESQSAAAGICIAAMVFLYYCDKLADYVSSTTAGSLIGIAIVIILLFLLVRFLTKSTWAGAIVGVILAAATAVTYALKPDSMSGLLPAVMDKISLFSRFTTFVDGVFDVTALVYYLSVIVFFLFLCVQALEKRRYNG